MDFKLAIGIALGLAIGMGCRWLGIPAPAPPVLQGALLVVCMTAGYQLAGHWLATHAARHAPYCGGPTGRGHGGSP
jgi:XapX domain-containing protein